MTAALILLLSAAPHSGHTAEVRALRLPREGSATVILSQEGDERTAYILDGGHRGSLTRETTLGGLPLLQYLSRNQYAHLVILCSHPHRDHLHGLKELVQYKAKPNVPGDLDLRDFKTVTFIDGDYPPSTSLAGYARAAHGEQDHFTYITARKGEDAFATVPEAKRPDIDIHTFPDPDRPDDDGRVHEHGRSILTYAVLSRPGSGETTLFLDTDDADDALLGRFVAWAVANLPETKHRVYILPHHASDLTDNTPLTREDLRPDAVIVPTDMDNNYLHPSPPTWKLWDDLLGPANVHMTAGAEGDSIIVTEEGVRPLSPEQWRDQAAAILPPLIERTRTKLRELRQRQTAGQAANNRSDRHATREAAALALYLKLVNQRYPGRGGGPPVPPLGPSPVSPVGPLGGGPESSRGGVRLDNGEPPEGGALASTTTDPRPPGSSPGGADNYRSLNAKFQNERIKLGGTTQARKTRGEIRGIRHMTSIQGIPVFGGVVIGSTVSAGRARLLRAEIRTRDSDDPDERVYEIALQVQTPDGTTWYIYDDMTPTELWAAYHYVKPNPAWISDYGVTDSECNLVGMSSRSKDGSEWTFGVHPAIADTPIARDAMILDMFLACLDSGRFTSPELSKHLDEVKGLWDSYQWHDSPARLIFQRGRIRVAPADRESGHLLRLRLWSALSQTLKREIEAYNDAAGEFEKSTGNLSLSFEAIRSLSLAFAEKKAKLKERATTEQEKNPDGFDIPFDGESFAGIVIPKWDSALQIEHFARLVAILNWVRDQGDALYPILPPEIANSAIHVAIEPLLLETKVAEELKRSYREDVAIDPLLLETKVAEELKRSYREDEESLQFGARIAAALYWIWPTVRVVVLNLILVLLISYASLLARRRRARPR